MPGSRLVLTAGAATDVGRVRTHNEDSGLAEGGLFLVADGMGGHAAGEVASGIAVDTMRELVGRHDLTAEAVGEQIGLANRRILDEMAADPDKQGMGTTVSGIALVVTGGTDHWAVFNVGDSRVYRLIDGALMAMTVDHSEVRELVDAGVITAEEARTHPKRNVVTRSLGTTYAATPDVRVVPPHAGERFLVCSDGLTGELTDDQVRDLLVRHADPQRAAEALVRAAVEAGGRDNVTVVVVDLGEAGADSSQTVTSPRAHVDTAPRSSHEGS
ncbi:hypothetical protein AWH69_02150 [Janibacter melonis]|uniref:PPM-type phosphatase domain-containing protein n=1 Tax=Janibacter melonis TaxID=262209 RepID=A0A176QHA5_9MICO|nr:hypothetical protein AWH69_02150 [Janibacter melonis]